jgi:hypothetical protein
MIIKILKVFWLIQNEFAAIICKLFADTVKKNSKVSKRQRL